MWINGTASTADILECLVEIAMADVARTYAVDATTIGRLAASSPFEQSSGRPCEAMMDRWRRVSRPFEQDAVGL